METGISGIVKKDLLSGKSKYVKDSYLIFNYIQINMEKDTLTVNLFYNSELLATIKQESQPPLGDIHFRLLDGRMKMDLI